MWWTANRISYAMDYLTESGLVSPYGAAGLVSRWKNVEAPDGPASRGGYLNRAWGIAQWLGDRLPPINGNPSFDAQLAYVIREISGQGPVDERRAGALLQSANDVQSGARAATAYERAGGWNAATNTDSYTARTAAGIPAVLAAWQNQPQIYTGQNGSQQEEGASTAEVLGIGGGALAVIGIGLFALFYLSSD